MDDSQANIDKYCCLKLTEKTNIAGLINYHPELLGKSNGTNRSRSLKNIHTSHVQV